LKKSCPVFAGGVLAYPGITKRRAHFPEKKIDARQYNIATAAKGPCTKPNPITSKTSSKLSEVKFQMIN